MTFIVVFCEYVGQIMLLCLSLSLSLHLSLLFLTAQVHEFETRMRILQFQ